MGEKIILDIRNANQTTKHKAKNELFQIEAFEKVTKILKEHSIGEDSKNIVDCRFHDTIFIDGDRGAGKTAFMLNIENYFEKIANEKKKFLFLDPVDPTLLEHKERFLGVILARIVEKVNSEIKKNACENNDLYLEQYYDSLEKLSNSLKALKTLDSDLGIDEIASNKSSLRLEQNAHTFFQVVSKLFNVHALIVLIDDVDMAFDQGFDVLEVVRKYLASPYLIPIVAGDLKLYKEIIENKFKDNMNLCRTKHCTTEEEYNEKLSLVNSLVGQYLRKVFPPEYHIQLKDIYTVIKVHQVLIKLDNDLIIPFSDIKDFEIRHINLGINQIENTVEIFENKTRSFIQYLFSKKGIYLQFFKMFGKENLSIRYNKYKPQKVSNLFDQTIFKEVINQGKVYRESFKETYEFYEFSENEEKRVLHNLTRNDYLAFEENTYCLYKALMGDYFQKTKNFPVEKASSTYRFKVDSFSEMKILEDPLFNDTYNYIMDLFNFNNYYSHQTRNYIYSGNFLECMIYSFNKIDKHIELEEDKINNIHSYISKTTQQRVFDYEELNNEIYSTIYDFEELFSYDNSLCTYFKETYQNFNSKEDSNTLIQKMSDDLMDIAYKIPFASDFFHKDLYKEEEEIKDDDIIESKQIVYSLEKLSYNIFIWQKVFLKNIKLNSLSLHQIILKFFKNIEVIKNMNFKHEPPIDFLRRIVLIFINAVAYFENHNKHLANTYIAVAKDFNFETLMAMTPAAVINIVPMVKEKFSLTRALFFHPIISHILFTDPRTKKLTGLMLVGQTKSKQDSEKSGYEKFTDGVYHKRLYSEDTTKSIIKLVNSFDTDELISASKHHRFSEFIKGHRDFTDNTKEQLKAIANKLNSK